MSMHESSRKASDEFIGPCAFLAAFERAAGRAVFSVDSKITRKIKHELKLQTPKPQNPEQHPRLPKPKLRIQSLSAVNLNRRAKALPTHNPACRTSHVRRRRSPRSRSCGAKRPLLVCN